MRNAEFKKYTLTAMKGFSSKYLNFSGYWDFRYTNFVQLVCTNNNFNEILSYYACYLFASSLSNDFSYGSIEDLTSNTSLRNVFSAMKFYWIVHYFISIILSFYSDTFGFNDWV